MHMFDTAWQLASEQQRRARLTAEWGNERRGRRRHLIWRRPQD